MVIVRQKSYKNRTFPIFHSDPGEVKVDPNHERFKILKLTLLFTQK